MELHVALQAIRWRNRANDRQDEYLTIPVNRDKEQILTKRSGYDSERPEFDKFLNAEIGVGANGIPLTVQTALECFDQNPHSAAAYLAGAPREAALESMMELVVALPPGSWNGRDPREIADDLLARLPQRLLGARGDAATDEAGRPTYGITPMRILAFLGFVAVAVFLVWGMQNEPTDFMDLGSGPSSAPTTVASSGVGASATLYPPHARERQASHASI